MTKINDSNLDPNPGKKLLIEIQPDKREREKEAVRNNGYDFRLKLTS